MQVTKTDNGSVRIATGGEMVTLTTAEALALLGRLVHSIDLTGPELDRVEDGWACPHCHRVQTELIEVDAGSVRHNDAEIDGDSVYPTESGERDFHTMSWLCRDCGQPVDVPAEMDVTYS